MGLPIEVGILADLNENDSEGADHFRAERLAEALSLPFDLDCDSKEVWEAAEYQGQSDTLWKKFGRESFSCLSLYIAAKHSIRNEVAIVFT
ncbi:hypothetical protein [Chthoniobacter flavus]|nr:hypothetical protein [Chthoniobacter flavus]